MLDIKIATTSPIILLEVPTPLIKSTFLSCNSQPTYSHSVFWHSNPSDFLQLYLP